MAALEVLLRSVARAERDAGAWYPRAIVLVTSDLPDLASDLVPLVPELGTPLQVVFAPSASTVGGLRNRAADRVTTQWIHFMDSDTEAPHDYFVRLRKAIATDQTTECFQLWFRAAAAASRWASFEAEIDRRVCALYQSDVGVCGLNGMNFLIRTERMRKERFREDLTAAEDVELGYRLHTMGVAVRLLPNVAVIHHYPNGVAGLLRRKSWHGRGYGSALPFVSGVYSRLPTARLARASLPVGTPAFCGYRRLARGVFRAGMALQRLRDRAWFRPAP